MNKLILLTGAGSSVGQFIAENLAARGAVIAAVDINPLGLDECLARVAAVNGQAKAYPFDIAKRLPVVALVKNILDDWGRIDVLINAAEVSPRDSLLTLDEWDFHRTLDVNLAGPFLLIQQVSHAMKEEGGGVIINLGNAPATSETPAEASNKAVAYQISKAALATLTKVAAQELAKENIRILWLEQGDEMMTKIWNNFHGDDEQA